MVTDYNDNVKQLFNLFSNITSQDVLEAELLAKIAVMISQERINREMTQKEFADFLGVSQTMISKWESSDYNFSIKLLAKVFDKLNKPIDFVYKNISEKTEKSCNACVNKRCTTWMKHTNVNKVYNKPYMGGM